MKVGDTVRIKSREWYDNNKNEQGYVDLPLALFLPVMAQLCGKIATITYIVGDGTFKINLDGGRYWWSAEMIEHHANDLPYSGLTKREFFAGLAVHAIISNPYTCDMSYSKIAECAVKQADALIVALSKE